MSGRYHFQETTYTIAASGGTATHVWSPENIPFNDVTLWIRGGAGCTYVVNYMDFTNVNIIGANIDTGSVAAVSASPTWLLNGTLPPTWRPSVTITNPTGAAMVVTVTWVGLTYQPNG